MQREQDVEVAALRAVARFTGAHVLGAPLAKALSPNPRLELATRAPAASTLRREVGRRGVVPAQSVTRKGRGAFNSRLKGRKHLRYDVGL